MADLNDINYSDSPIDFNKALLDAMLKALANSALGGGAILVKKDNYTVKYESQADLMQAIKSLKTEIYYQENGACFMQGACL